jgi:hypothetical protein
MKKSGITKNKYQQKISEYTSRREKLRARYGRVLHSPKPNPEYRKAVQRINYKLTQWRRAIKRIEERQDRLEVIARYIADFYELHGIHATWKNNAGAVVDSLRLKHSHLNTDPNVVLARKLFYKYCLENGFSSPDVMMYISGGNANHGRYWATEARRQFTRSFKTNLHHKLMWDRFMSYMKQHHQQQLKRVA